MGGSPLPDGSARSAWSREAEARGYGGYGPLPSVHASASSAPEGHLEAQAAQGLTQLPPAQPQPPQLCRGD